MSRYSSCLFKFIYCFNDLKSDIKYFNRDGDGIPNDEDSCPFYSNPSQSDIDNDGIGRY